jgi:ABC-2 type transport system permease protein
MIQWIAFWNIVKKDMRNYYLKPPNISWGIIFPFAWTLMFFLKSRSDVDLRQILPGVVAMSILFGTTSMLAVTITFERRSRSFERLLLAPLRLTWLMAAKTLGAIIFGVLNAFVPILFVLLFFGISGFHWASLTLGIVLIAITSTFVGLFIAVSVSEVFEAQTFSNFLRFPMLFLCGLFFPLDRLPLFLRPVAYLLPLTYGADLVKYAILDQASIPIGSSVFLLIVFTLGLFYLSYRNIKKRWIY